MLTPVIVLNNSPAKGEVLPLPNEAMLILPGLAWASAMNSATVLAGSAGFTFIAKGKDARPATGIRSRNRSKGSDSKSVALTAFEAVTRAKALLPGDDNGTAPPSVFHRCRRGRAHHARPGAASHAATAAQPTDQ